MVGEQQCHLQVVIVSGAEDVARATLGFAFAVSAAVSGVKVTVILALNGIDWTTNNELAAKRSVNAFDSISEYMSILGSSGAVVRLCAACAEGKCLIEHENESAGPSYIGLAEAAIRTANGSAQTVVF
jgi:predicted peroxiredoxin